MSYLVLARKYRPTAFSDIVGQEHIVRTLGNAIKLNRVHHAFLFTGARGVGKTTTARVLARALNCEKGPTLTPCDECAVCKDILHGSSPDVLEIDGASNTGVDSVRELRDTVRFLPQKGRTKLYIIDEVHMLSTAAFNALLKTLEEPPPHVKFIFATTEPHKIPVTILSRCQRFDFRRVSTAGLVEHVRAILVKENLDSKLSPGALAMLVREAQGSVRDALSLLDQVLSFGGDDLSDSTVASALGLVERGLVFSLANAVLKREAKPLLDIVAEIDAKGHDLADVSGLLVEHFRDLAVVKVAEQGDATAWVERSPSEMEELRAQAALASKVDLHRYFSLLVTTSEDVARSAHARLSLEMGLLRLLEVEPTHSLNELLQRLGGAGGTQSPSGGAKASAASMAAPAAAKGNVSVSSAGPVSAADSPGEAWIRFVDRVRKLRPATASVLEHGRVLNFGPAGVEIAYAGDSFYFESAREADTKALLTKVLTEQFGQAVDLKIVAAGEAPQAAKPSIAEHNAHERQRREREIKDSAVAHPAVQNAIAMLGGQVTDVVALGLDPE